MQSRLLSLSCRDPSPVRASSCRSISYPLILASSPMGIKRTQDGKHVECTIEGCSFRKRFKAGKKPHYCPECRLRKKSLECSVVDPTRHSGSESEPATASPVCKPAAEADRDSGHAGGAPFALDPSGGASQHEEEPAHAEKATVQEATENDLPAAHPATVKPESGLGRSGVLLPTALKRLRDGGGAEEPGPEAPGPSAELAEGCVGGPPFTAACPGGLHAGGAAAGGPYSGPGGTAGHGPPDSGPGAGSAEAGRDRDTVRGDPPATAETDQQPGASTEEWEKPLPVLLGAPSHSGALPFPARPNIAPPCVNGDLVKAVFATAVPAAASGSMASAGRVAAAAVGAASLSPVAAVAAAAAAPTSPIAGAEASVSQAAELNAMRQVLKFRP